MLFQTLAHTLMVVAAMTGHGDVVAWCAEKTAARPFDVAPALVCIFCSGHARSCVLLHTCGEKKRHMARGGWQTNAVLAACFAGDLSLLRRLMRDHVECDAGVREGTMRGQVSACTCQ